ncbi:MAG: shikimate dehydrogenase [Armatimonadetes bacterium]|nr:shikimate dehydrogenase [Armatimonadota bacterium]
MLRGTTKLVGVIGFPIEHSLSPPMHNAAFAKLGMDWAYVAYRVEPEHAPEAIRGIVALGMVGLNVTIPHKQAAAELVDELDDAARALQSVNTVHNLDGALKGYSTDGPGFVRSVEETGATLEGKAVTLIGAGGSARAVAHALVSAGVDSLTLAARRPQKAEEIAAMVAEHTGRSVAVVDLSSNAAREAVTQSDILVDSTSVGMHPNVDVPPVIPPDWMHAGQLVCDLTYNPRETTLLRAARPAGADTLDGTGMLVHQGAIAFEIWTGATAPVETMREALLRALG